MLSHTHSLVIVAGRALVNVCLSEVLMHAYLGLASRGKADGAVCVCVSGEFHLGERASV